MPEQKTALELADERQNYLTRAIVEDYSAARAKNRQFVRGVCGQSDAEVEHQGQVIVMHKRNAGRFRDYAAKIAQELSER